MALIYIIEDDESIREIEEFALKNAGHNVVGFENSKDFYRKIQKELQEWKDSPFRKPLVLRGARQTGKTTVINQFSKEFDTYIYLNLEKEKLMQTFGLVL